MQVLKSGGWIDVLQDDAYSDILLQELPRLKQTFEADGLGSKSWIYNYVQIESSVGK